MRGFWVSIFRYVVGTGGGLGDAKPFTETEGLMMGRAANLKGYIEEFKAAGNKISGGIKNAGDIWKDSNYASLHKQMGELAKASKSVIESGERACASVDRFFGIADEKVEKPA